ncbi:Hsp70 family protein [Streptomyces chrestomyceticus]|uniref:Hsp70 family protein n=1 Tax=Streptomyces chrestomyceticus TaxID=68185 RepID=UPI00379D87F9
MAKTSDSTVIVGFDLGHGESALAKTYTDKTAPPVVLDIGSTGAGRQHVTAVAEHPGRGVLVGREATEARGVTSLYLAFKSPEIERDEVRIPIRLFVEKVGRDARERDQDLSGARPVRWVFGAPSGWGDELIGVYGELLSQAGLTDVEVVRESRAAMLYARDSGEVQIERDQLGGCVLIADIGSLTTDFTGVFGYQTGPPIDAGVQLGAGLIDRTILERQLSRHPLADALRETLQDSRFERLRLELLCREAKETFFRTDPSRFVDDPEATVGGTRKVVTRAGNAYFEVELTAAEMEAVLDTPQPSLGNRPWRQAFRDALHEAAGRLGRDPELVVLTGGASRMHFVQEEAREAFGADRVLLGLEPELAIARGLTLAGRMGLHAAGFRADVRKLIKGDRVGSLVQDRLPALGERLGAAVAEGMTERHVIPAFRRWRNGDIATLDEMAKGISRALHAELAEPGNARLAEAIAEWQNELRPEIEELTRPICHRWHIPPSAMELPAVQVSGGQMDVPFDSAAATEVLDNIAKVVNVVVAGVVAMTLFGAGTAIIATTGPFAVIIAAVVLFIGINEGREAAMAKARQTNIPLMMRKVGGENRLVSKLRQGAGPQEAQLAAAFSAQFIEDGGQKLVSEISKGIAADLEALARDAELFIS